MDTIAPIIFNGTNIFDCVFNATANRYYKRDGNEWIQLTREDIKSHLRAESLDWRCAKGDDLSQVDAALVAIQNTRRVHYALPLAGYPTGVLEVSSFDGTRKRILVTSDTKPLEAVEGEWTHIKEYLTQLLGEKGFRHQMGWWKWARKNLKAKPHTRLPAQVMVYVGPAGCGKSFLQKMTTRLLGGRSANPFNYMSGQTSFNRDLFEADHLIVEDCFHDVNMAKRRAFGAKLKEFTVNDTLSCHGKGQDAIRLVPKWRISISMNGEHENMSQFPPLDDSLKDKVMLFKCKMPTFPTDLSTESGWKAWDAIIDREVGGLAHAIDTFEMNDIAAARFGVKAYHDAELLEVEDESSPLTVLTQLIVKELIPMHPHDTEWTGTSLDLHTLLTNKSLCDSAPIAEKLFYYASACGAYLGRIREKKPKLVSCKTIRGTKHWTLYFDEFK